MKKRKWVIRVSCLFFVIVVMYYILSDKPKEFRESLDMDVLNTHTMRFSNYCVEYVSVNLNSMDSNDFDFDEGKIRDEILQRYEENSFHSVQFSVPLSSVDRLCVDVYRNEDDYKSGVKIFSIEYP